MPVRNKGFTLVELLVVISIIAILSVIGITVFTNVQRNARDAKRKGDIKAIANALEVYKTTNGTYPLLPDSSYGAVSTEDNWTAFAVLLNPYIQELPKDPQNQGGWSTGKFYKYHTDPTGTFYQVAASLEDTNGATGNFTYNCATSDCRTGSPNCAEVTGAHKSVPDCIFNQTNGGFGYDSQQ